ncbi:MAG: hypothetical protein IJT32_04225 [Lachnospiraceae bacterium]|nr:hypothetical protein [Lachnospiraceae bacterium]
MEENKSGGVPTQVMTVITVMPEADNRQPTGAERMQMPVMRMQMRRMRTGQMQGRQRREQQTLRIDKMIIF